MERAKSPSKLPTPLCEVEDYYSGDFSSISLKQVVQLETKDESSKTIVMQVMTTATIKFGGGDGCHEDHAGKGR